MKGKRNVWAVFLGIAVAAMSAAGCVAGESSGQGPEKVSAEKRLTVYTSHKQEVYAPIIKEFEERTGIWVEGSRRNDGASGADPGRGGEGIL